MLPVCFLLGFVMVYSCLVRFLAPLWCACVCFVFCLVFCGHVLLLDACLLCGARVCVLVFVWSFVAMYSCLMRFLSPLWCACACGARVCVVFSDRVLLLDLVFWFVSFVCMCLNGRVYERIPRVRPRFLTLGGAAEAVAARWSFLSKLE